MRTVNSMFRVFFENFMKLAFTVHLRWHWQSYF